MRFIFTRNDSFLSHAVRLIDGGDYSHVAVVDNDTHIIEANYNCGVRRRTLASLLEACPDHIEIRFDVPFPDDALSFLRLQVGKPYDFAAVFGLPFRLGVDDHGKWFCSELAMATARAGGLDLSKRTWGVKDCLAKAWDWST